MFGASYFGPSYFGGAYFGGAAATATIRARATEYSAPAVRITEVSSEEADTMTTQIDGQPVTVRRTTPNNAHLARVFLERFDADSNDYIPWDDAEDVEVAFCTDRRGASVISGMGPFAMTAVDAAFPGYFHYEFPAAVTALLDAAALRGTLVYQRVTAGANAELKVVTPFIVGDPRFAG